MSPESSRIARTADADPLVCIVEPDAAVRDSLLQFIKLLEKPVLAVASGTALARELPTLSARCIVCAADLPEFSGIDLYRQLQAQRLNVPFAITVSGHQYAIINEAEEAGIEHIFYKPLLISTGLLEFIASPVA